MTDIAAESQWEAMSEQVLFDQMGIPSLFHYKGTKLPVKVGAELLRWSTFEARSSDIWISSLPRTGTTWTQEIIHSLLYLHRLDEADEKSLRETLTFFDMPDKHGESEVDNWTHCAALPEPRTIKTHLPYDALPDSVKSVKPKDLPSNIRRIAAFIGVSSKGEEGGLSDEDVAIVAQRASIDHMRTSKHANLMMNRRDENMLKGGAISFIRKGQVGDWRNYFGDNAASRQYDEWIRKNLAGSGLHFDYD